GIELVRKGVRVHTAARQVGVSDPVLRRQACKLGLCVPVSQLQLSDAGFGYRCSGDPVLPGSG
ncbi:hypothetical protein, partial [Corynebacterium striatum]|uniref:hypothetical protein n=1 Tax=Corynebacterium striatum TaxID=43770 RepID=UPI003EC942CE